MGIQPDDPFYPRCHRAKYVIGYILPNTIPPYSAQGVEPHVYASGRSQSMMPYECQHSQETLGTASSS